MNHPTKSCVLALRTLLPLLSAVCVWGCSGAEPVATNDNESSPANLQGSTDKSAVTGSDSDKSVTLTLSPSADAAVSTTPPPATAPADNTIVLTTSADAAVSTTPPPATAPADNTIVLSESPDAAAPTTPKPAAPPLAAGVGFSAKVVAVNGSGCPLGSATITATTADSLTVSIPGYSVSNSQIRRNCIVMFDVSVPTGYTYTLTSASLSGTANLATGAKGSVGTYYYFTGTSGTATNTQTLASGKWSSSGVFADDSLLYAPCDASSYLSVNTSLMLTGADAGSTISLDPSMTLKLSVHKCQ